MSLSLSSSLWLLLIGCVILFISIGPSFIVSSPYAASSSFLDDSPYSLYQLRNGISGSPEFFHVIASSINPSSSSSSSSPCPSSLSIELQSVNAHPTDSRRLISLIHSNIAQPLSLSSGRSLCFYSSKHLPRDLIALNVEIENSRIESIDGIIELSNSVYLMTAYHRHPHRLSLSVPQVQSMHSSSSSSLHVMEKIDRPAMINKNTLAKCAVASSIVGFTPSSSGKRLFAQDNIPRYLELVLVHDKKRASQYATQDDALISGSKIAHITDSLFGANELNPPLRVVLMRQVITASNANADAWGTPTFSSDGGASVDSLLQLFNRHTATVSTITQYDVRVLLSGYDFEKGVIGYAPVGLICNRDNSGAIVQSAYFSDVLAAATVTHEIGHVIGMSHDLDPLSTDPCYKEGNYIMSAYATRNPAQKFSSCSKNQWAKLYTQAKPRCVENKPDMSKAWTIGSCGDGIVTGAEACDCGPEGVNKASCPNDPCCNPATCQLVSGAQCSAAQSCCTQSCMPVPRSSNRVCRYSQDSQCDIEERCDGVSADCPLDLVASSGQGCQDTIYNTGSGLCFNGACHTPDKACLLLAKNRGYPLSGWRSCTPTLSSSCGPAYCTNDTRRCTAPFNSQTNDGTPCGASSSPNQCKNGRCVSSSELDITGSYPISPAEPDGFFIGPIDYNFKTILALSIVGGVVGFFCIAAFIRWKKRKAFIEAHQRSHSQPPPSVAVALPPNASDFARSAYASSGIAVADPSPAPSPSAAQSSNPARRASYLGTIAMPEGIDPQNVAPSGGENAARNASIALNDVQIAALMPNSVGGGGGEGEGAGFEAHVTSKGIPYWFNSMTGVTSWSDPAKGPINPNRPDDA